jgi:hypothetical protein
VLTNPDTGALSNGQGSTIERAIDTTEEVEARLPRVLLILPDDPGTTGAHARDATMKLRESVRRLRDYVHQPGSGETFSFDERQRSREAFDAALTSRDAFLRAAQRVLR